MAGLHPSDCWILAFALWVILLLWDAVRHADLFQYAPGDGDDAKPRARSVGPSQPAPIKISVDLSAYGYGYVALESGGNLTEAGAMADNFPVPPAVDHVGLKLQTTEQLGEDAKVHYTVTADSDPPEGLASLGVSPNDGRLGTGDAAAALKVTFGCAGKTDVAVAVAFQFVPEGGASVTYKDYVLRLVKQCGAPAAKGTVPPAGRPSIQGSLGPEANHTEAQLADVARRVAPLLIFDAGAITFPVDPLHYYRATVLGGAPAQESNGSYPDISNHQVPVHYVANACGREVRVAYWVFYTWQPPCLSSENATFGQHQVDWEHVVVVTDRGNITAVQYYQHGGHYTRYPGGFETHRDAAGHPHPVVYVGQSSHGHFHAQSGDGPRCCYWDDSRHPGPGGALLQMETWQNLTAVKSTAWGNYTGNWHTDGGNNTRDFFGADLPACDLLACKGSDGPCGRRDGCAQSQCPGHPGHTTDCQDPDGAYSCLVNCTASSSYSKETLLI